MKLRHARMLALCLPLLGVASAAQAFIVNIGGGITPSMYLRVGDGSGGTLNGGGLGDGGPINLVSVAVPAAVLGNGGHLAMTSNTTQSWSSYANFVFCNVPQQVYVGGVNRGGWCSGGNGVLTVTAPANLTNAHGDPITYSKKIGRAPRRERGGQTE